MAEDERGAARRREQEQGMTKPQTFDELVAELRDGVEMLRSEAERIEVEACDGWEFRVATRRDCADLIERLLPEPIKVGDRVQWRFDAEGLTWVVGEIEDGAAMIRTGPLSLFPECATVPVAVLSPAPAPSDTEQEPTGMAHIEVLYATTDAAVWADEFAKVCPSVDRGLMIGWFANAMQTAIDHERSDKTAPAPSPEVPEPTPPGAGRAGPGRRLACPHLAFWLHPWGCVVSQQVPPDEIEQIVGARRHDYLHLGRAVSAEQTVYVLHPRACVDSGRDLRDCSWSWALDNGIDADDDWVGYLDRPVLLAKRKGHGGYVLAPRDLPATPGGEG